jgi:membrane dipeptidase
MVEAAHRLAEQKAYAVTLCLDGSEVDAALEADRIAPVLGLDGCPQIDTDIELPQLVYRLGVRRELHGDEGLAIASTSVGG